MPDSRKNATDIVPGTGARAYKVNRAGLVPPTPNGNAAPPSRTVAPVTPVIPSERKTRSWGVVAASSALALGAVALLWHAIDKRSASAEARPPAESAAPALAEAAPKAALPSYRALVIGINDYSKNGGDGWQTLNSARADAEAIAKTLSSDYGFHVQTLLDGEATRSAILNALDELATSGSDGADLIYFAGHGFYDEKLQEGYWIPADARKTVDGRQAKEDWLWNSTITRLINASHARHVLVLSDACYSGSLFRGDEPLSSRGQAWYARAIAKPSRYLITSGGLEPVLDSGAGHSVFAQQVINFLSHGERSIFSANDLGLALRERVAALTGQMVQMGPLPVSGHAGGEFVFVRQQAGKQLAALTPQPETATPGETRGADPAAEAKSRQDAIRDAVALTRAGAPKAANALVSTLLQQNAQDQLARVVSEYIARSARQESRDELQKLIEQVAAKGKEAAGAPGAKAAAAARPRVLACLGPSLPQGTSPDAESLALLYRIALRSELESRAGLKVIEREALETILQEQNVGVSDLADARARLAIGKLLPASLLLLGDLIPSDKGEKIFVRLVDTETTQVLSSFTVSRKGDEDQEKVCADLAAKIAERIALLKPLLAPVTEVKGAKLVAALGSYHGIRAGLAFTVVSRTLRDKRVADDFVEKELGTATITAASDFSCELDAAWGAAGAPERSDELWIREAAK